MKVTNIFTTLALAILSGAQISLAAPQLNTFHERQNGVGLVVQKFPDSNCREKLEENKFHLEPLPEQCIKNITNANSIQMVEQPICTITTFSGTDCEGSSFGALAGDECHPDLPFASFKVICENIP